MRIVRTSLFAVGLLLAMLPAATQAKTLEEKAAANAANDAARCMLKAQGVHLPGKVAPSTPAAAAACAQVFTSVEARALQTLPSSFHASCPFIGPVPKAQLAPLFDYMIKKSKAEAKNKPVPMPSQTVLALEACG